MSTLYVDIDDTLVTWLSDEGGSHPYGHAAKDWRVNANVLRLAESWPGRLVIWSGGGKDYAETWANRLLPHLTWTAHSKYNAIPGPGDVFVDDMPFDAWKHASIHPDSLESVTPEDDLDALLAEHMKLDEHTDGGGCCAGCDSEPWPCTIYLLASEVRDARPFWEAMRECREWAEQQFPNSRPEGKAKHLAKEAYELAADPTNTEEMADVLMIFAHLADWEGVDLAVALRSKLAINRGRTWGAPDADGVIEHVRALAHYEEGTK